MDLISPYSLCVLSLELLARTKESLGYATAVIMQARGRYFLVTNYHVLSGRHPYTTDQNAEAIPDFVRVKYLVQKAGVELPRSVEIDHPLYRDEDKPLWIALAKEKRMLPTEANGVKLAIDVAILEVSKIPQNVGVLQFDPPTEFLIPVMEQVAIIGYPFHLSGTEDLPLWLSGTVASDLANRPYRRCFFVDAKTREGCSGSLVVLKTKGARVDRPGGKTDGQGDVFHTVGIYSGRLPGNSDIGIVWHWNTVAQTLGEVFV